jgi:hypothetical protein
MIVHFFRLIACTSKLVLPVVVVTLLKPFYSVVVENDLHHQFMTRYERVITSWSRSTTL